MSFRDEPARQHRRGDAVASEAEWWLAQMGRPECEPLSAADEHALAVRARAGDRTARTDLITHNLRLVIGIARRYVGVHGATLDDLVSEGNRGLMHAVDKFDPTRTGKLSTYATYWIRQACQRYTDGADLIPLPSYVVQAQRNIARVVRAAEEAGEDEPTPDAVCAAVDISRETYDAVRRQQTPVSLDAPMRYHGAHGTPGTLYDAAETLAELIEDGAAVGAEQAAEEADAQDEARAHLWRLFEAARLSQRERQVLALRYAGGQDGAVSLICTSPPYWSLRDYDVPPTTWHADPTCQHDWSDYQEQHEERESAISGKTRTTERYYGDVSRRFDGNHQRHTAGAVCRLCGAFLCPLGMEPSPDCDEAARPTACGRCYACHLVELFRELRRVLRSDGTCWLNLGDAYAGSWGNYAPGGIKAQQREQHEGGERWERRAYGDTRWRPASAGLQRRGAHPSLKNKDLLLLPHRVALALQRDGWWVRQDNVWAKRNCMPESVTDRTTRSHEYVFQLAKAERYYYDTEAVREQHSAPFRKSGPNALRGQVEIRPRGNLQTIDEQSYHPGGRNARSVWHIATRPFSEAHFATFPPELVERCVLAGTSPRACEACGAPWRRVTARELVDAGTWSEQAGKKRGQAEGTRDRTRANGTVFSDSSVFNSGLVGMRHTTGWEPTCACPATAGTGRCLVLDPFMGAGTTGLVARLANRDYLGIELNPTYARMAERRIARFGRPIRPTIVPAGTATLWDGALAHDTGNEDEEEAAE